MYRYEAKEYITTHPEIFLQLDRQSQHGFSSNPGYVCPICGSGSGNNGTGITSKKANDYHYTCFANRCFKHNDVIDIIGRVHGLTSYNDKLEKACELYGIDYSTLECDPDFKTKKKQAHASTCDTQRRRNQRTTKPEDTDQPNYLQFILDCTENRHQTDYLNKRGISDAVQKKYYVGYFEHWRNPIAIAHGKNPPFSPRIIIPTSKYSYFARDVRAYSMDQRYDKVNIGNIHLFNIKSLAKMTEPFFVTEGIIDAMSIIEVGHNAVALGGTSNYDMLVDYLMENRPSKPVLIALDNDKPGWDAAKKLQASLKELEIEYYCLISEINGEYKDPNERLIADRDGLRKAVGEAVRRYD